MLEQIQKELINIRMRKKLCEKCNYEYAICNFEKHFPKCNGNINYWKRKQLGVESPYENLIVCRFCQRVGKSFRSNVTHETFCKNNPDKKYRAPSYGMKGKKGSNQYIKGTAKPHSEKLLNFYKNSPKRGVAVNDSLRWKRKEYPTADSFGNEAILESMNEVNFAKLCEELNIRWTKAKRFKLSNGKSYNPDFHLVDFNIYTDPKSIFWMKNFNHNQQEKINLFEKEYNTKLVIFWDTELSTWKNQLLELTKKD